MSRVSAALRAAASEAVGLVADDWRLPLGITVILAAGWALVGGSSLAGRGYIVAVALALSVVVSALLEARARRRTAAA